MCGVKGLGLLVVDVLLCAVLFVDVVTTVTQTVLCVGWVCNFYGLIGVVNKGSP